MNLFAATEERISGANAELSFDGLMDGPVRVPVRPGTLTVGDKVALGLRPEHLIVGGRERPHLKP